MEGIIAAWYAKVTAKSLGEFRDDASRVAAGRIRETACSKSPPGRGI